MRILRIAIAVAAFALGGRAFAGDLAITVRTPNGAPAANVVVTVHAAQAGAPIPGRQAWPTTIVQRDMRFDPFVLLVAEGASVSFPNQDTVRHHVYSFWDTKRFELKLYGKGETRSVTFDKAGVAAVG